MDYGMLGGLNQGVSGFLNAYYNEKNRQDALAKDKEDRAMQKKLYNLQLAKSGYQENPDTGEFQKSPDQLQKEKTAEFYKKADYFSKGETVNPETGEMSYNPEFFKMKSESDPYASVLKNLQIQKVAGEIKDKNEKNAFEKSPEGKLQKLSAAEKQRLDNITMASNAVKDMEDAMKGGEKMYSLIGDNPFTASKTSFAEALGRMQSGGAISKQEEERFKQMAPSITDSEEERYRKVTKLKQEMQKRLGTLGFSDENAGLIGLNPDAYKPSNVEQKEQPLMNKVMNLGILKGNKANAGPKKPKTVIQNGHTYQLNEQTGEYE